mmetsp:Transcript_10391/g.24642  ORF Transcript_10391/g.24642 Transcript_10391/m.24642 type:complete len:211 (+) Transcript_10391:338-970(+)
MLPGGVSSGLGWRVKAPMLADAGRPLAWRAESRRAWSLEVRVAPVASADTSISTSTTMPSERRRRAGRMVVARTPTTVTLSAETSAASARAAMKAVSLAPENASWERGRVTWKAAICWGASWHAAVKSHSESEKAHLKYSVAWGQAEQQARSSKHVTTRPLMASTWAQLVGTPPAAVSRHCSREAPQASTGNEGAGESQVGAAPQSQPVR